MSGTQSSLFGGGSRWITNPKHLNCISNAKANISLKAASTTIHASSAAAFFTSAAVRGAQASITVADTYVTVANLTGSGFAFNFISPTHDGTFTPTIRITVDGTVYTIAPSAVAAAGNRLVIGPTTSGFISVSTAAAAIASDISGVNSAQDHGFTGSMVGGVQTVSGTVGIPSPEFALSLGMQALRFESSLLVEMKASGLSASSIDKQCAVTYRLDL